MTVSHRSHVLSSPSTTRPRSRLLHRVGGPARAGAIPPTRRDLSSISICASPAAPIAGKRSPATPISKIDLAPDRPHLARRRPLARHLLDVSSACFRPAGSLQECFYAWMTAVMNRRGLTPVLSIRRNSSSAWPSTASASAVRPPHRRSIGPARRPSLVGGESPDLGPSRHRLASNPFNEIIGHYPRVARALGPRRGRGDHRCHGLSERHRRQDRRRGWPVRAGRQGRTSSHLYEDIAARRSTRLSIRASRGSTSPSARPKGPGRVARRPRTAVLIYQPEEYVARPAGRG